MTEPPLGDALAMQVFLSYKFDDPVCEAQASLLRGYIKALGLRYVDGRMIGRSGELNSQIKARIKSSDRFLAIHNEGLISDYLRDELMYAEALGVQTVIVTNTVGSLTGLRDNLPLIMFGDSVHDACVEIVRELYHWRLRAIFGDQCASELECSDEDASEIFAKLSELNLLDGSRHRRDFEYSVALEEHLGDEFQDFYKATFTVRFHSPVPNAALHIDTRKARNNFHKVYNDLVQDRDSIYRYIIKTPPGFSISRKHFVVTDFQVGPLSLEVDSVAENSSGVRYTFEHEDLAAYVSTGSPQLFYIRIETIVRKDQNEFTMIFGYPVHGLSVRLQYEGTDISSLDVVDIFTSRQNTQKSPVRRGDHQIGAEAKVVGWVLPESAVVFVWERCGDSHNN
jgi:hypothetical protein